MQSVREAAVQKAEETKLQMEEKAKPGTGYRPTPAGIRPKVTVQYKPDPTRTMLAAQWVGTEKVEVRRVPAPDITDPCDVIVRNTSVTVCGSDLHLYFNKVPAKQGLVMQEGDIMGHEAMGIIDKVGPEVKDRKVGDRVVISAPISCGQCDYCKEGSFSLCEVTNTSQALDIMYGHRIGALFGYSHLLGGWPGSQAEYVRVPFADVNTLKVPEDLPDEKLLLLSDVIPTGWHGNELSQVSKNSSVAVWGCGPVGLMSAYLARNIRQAHHVISIDHHPFRLEKAAKNGCDTFNFDKGDVVKMLKDRMPPVPSSCIDCVGFRFPKTTASWLELKLGVATDTCDIVREMIIGARKGGHLALIGDYFDVTNGYPIGAFMEKALTQTGGQLYCQKYWKHLLQLIVEGKLDPTWEFSHRFKLEQIPEAYKMFAHDRDNVLKVIVYTDFGEQWEREHKARFRAPGHPPPAAHGQTGQRSERTVV